MKLSKRYKKLIELNKDKSSLIFDEALKKVKQNCNTKFDESIDISFFLNVKKKKKKLI